MRVPKIVKVYATTLKHARMYDELEQRCGKMEKEQLEMVMCSWAKELLDHIEIDIEQIGNVTDQKAILVGNHVSYVDIPLVMSQAPLSFVAKAELLKWPVFNQAFRRAHIIFVKRQSQSSRRSSADAIIKAIEDGPLNIAVFPSGTTDIAEKKPWRRGPFKIAKSAGIPVQPFRITYTPLRKAAYIDNDFFPYHLFQLLRTDNIKATIEFHEPVMVDDPGKDAEKWWHWSQEIHKK